MSGRCLGDVSVVGLIFNGLRCSYSQVRGAFAMSSCDFKPPDAFVSAFFLFCLRVKKHPNDISPHAQKRICGQFLSRGANFDNGVVDVDGSPGLEVKGQMQQQDVLHPLPVR
jgi:hypothetical protein